MNTDQIRMLQESWALVAPNGEAAIASFYQRLFEIDPSTRPLFRSVDASRQHVRLVQALTTTIGSLARPEELLPMLEQLGRRHAGYGVSDSHFDSVGQALLWTLAQGLGEAWSGELEAAWIDAYGVVSEVMRRAMNDQRSAAPSPAFHVRALEAARAENGGV
ncbi:MAG: hypothetical protein KDG52_19080 [Rhodocyclaceae bacterium]|nr:hypothetical protein [Rhodocyclaceae bacterium]